MRRNSTVAVSSITTKYIKSTEEYNELHHAAMTDPGGVLRRRLFDHASDPWEGETLALKVALIEATENWEALTGRDRPCPIVFDAEDVRKTLELDVVQRQSDEILLRCQNLIDFGANGWVPTEDYEEAMTRIKKMKEDTLARAESEEEWAQIMEHWPFGDMDEKEYK